MWHHHIHKVSIGELQHIGCFCFFALEFADPIKGAMFGNLASLSPQLKDSVPKKDSPGVIDSRMKRGKVRRICKLIK